MTKPIECVKIYCPQCKVDVVAIPKVFNVKLCPQCNRILASKYPIEKAGM